MKLFSNYVQNHLLVGDVVVVVDVVVVSVVVVVDVDVVEVDTVVVATEKNQLLSNSLYYLLFYMFRLESIFV